METPAAAAPAPGAHAAPHGSASQRASEPASRPASQPAPQPAPRASSTAQGTATAPEQAGLRAPPIVILVGPQHPGNVGAAARVAANFGVTQLRIVQPECDVRAKEAYDRAIHAKPLLDEAVVYGDLASALEGIALAVGTTARSNKADHRFQRKPLDVRDLIASLAGWDGQMAWVFGREDSGLTAHETDQLDQLVTIPTAAYWSLNLSHAVGICCYESFRLGAQSVTVERSLAPGALQALNKAFDDLVEETESRAWRKRTASTVWRKVVGRSAPDTYEVHNVMGILANALKRFGHPGYETPESRRILGERGMLVPGDRGASGEEAGEAAGEPVSAAAAPGRARPGASEGPGGGGDGAGDDDGIPTGPVRPLSEAVPNNRPEPTPKRQGPGRGRAEGDSNLRRVG